jgi:hypothetical protein
MSLLNQIRTMLVQHSRGDVAHEGSLYEAVYPRIDLRVAMQTLPRAFLTGLVIALLLPMAIEVGTPIARHVEARAAVNSLAEFAAGLGWSDGVLGLIALAIVVAGFYALVYSILALYRGELVCLQSKQEAFGYNSFDEGFENPLLASGMAPAARYARQGVILLPLAAFVIGAVVMAFEPLAGLASRLRVLAYAFINPLLSVDVVTFVPAIEFGEAPYLAFLVPPLLVSYVVGCGVVGGYFFESPDGVLIRLGRLWFYRFRAIASIALYVLAGIFALVSAIVREPLTLVPAVVLAAAFVYVVVQPLPAALAVLRRENAARLEAADWKVAQAERRAAIRTLSAAVAWSCLSALLIGFLISVWLAMAASEAAIVVAIVYPVAVWFVLKNSEDMIVRTKLLALAMP